MEAAADETFQDMLLRALKFLVKYKNKFSEYKNNRGYKIDLFCGVWYEEGEDMQMIYKSKKWISIAMAGIMLCQLATGCGSQKEESAPASKNDSPNYSVTSDEIVYTSDRIEDVVIADKFFDENGAFHIIGQNGVGTNGETEAKGNDLDTIVNKNNLSEGTITQVYEQKPMKGKKKAAGYYTHYAMLGDKEFAASYDCAEVSMLGFKVGIVWEDLEEGTQKVWNLTDIMEKEGLTPFAGGVSRIVLTGENMLSIVECVNTNQMIQLNTRTGKIEKSVQLPGKVLYDHNSICGNILSCVISDEENNMQFKAFDMASLEEVFTLDLEDMNTGYGQSDLVYCDGVLFRLQEDGLSIYQDSEKEFVLVPNSTTENKDGEQAYNYHKIYGVSKDELYALQAVMDMEDGDCSKCEIHKLQISS